MEAPARDWLDTTGAESEQAGRYRYLNLEQSLLKS